MTRFLDLKTQMERLVLTQLPTALPEQIDEDIYEVIRDFYRQTTVWRTELGPFNRQKGSNLVYLSAPPGTAVNMVHRLRYNGTEPISAFADGQQWGWGADRPELVTVYPAPKNDEVGTIEIEASLLPVDPYVTVPDTASTHWVAGIVAGCLARLYGQAAKPWYNPSEARAQARPWLKAVADAKTVSIRGYTARPLLATNPFGRFA